MTPPKKPIATIPLNERITGSGDRSMLNPKHGKYKPKNKENKEKK